ncbi:MAG: GNAT family N-acetyltransferase [Muribaculaceae bacterium]|nr:GNAT family N-acetyltransferase [Muribaculaceae bacterium]
MLTLSDNKITLRAPEPTDLDSLYLLENDPRTWLDGATLAPLSRKQLWDYISSYDGDIISVGQLRLVIMLNDIKEIAGVIDLYDYDKISRRAYIGIVVKEQYRNQGIAGRALRMLIDYCRQRLSMRQLAAIVRADNIPSEHLFKASGFEVTGHFPNWLRTSDGWADALHLQLEL